MLIAALLQLYSLKKIREKSLFIFLITAIFLIISKFCIKIPSFAKFFKQISWNEAVFVLYLKIIKLFHDSKYAHPVYSDKILKDRKVQWWDFISMFRGHNREICLCIFQHFTIYEQICRLWAKSIFLQQSKYSLLIFSVNS